MEEKQALAEKNRRFLAHFPAFLKFLLIYAGTFTIPEIFYLVFDSTFEEGNMTLNILATLAGMLVYLVILTRVFTKKNDENIVEILQIYPKRLELKTIGLLIALGISLNLVMSGLVGLIPFPDEWVNSYTGTTSTVLNTDSLAISLTYVIVIAPIFEEIFFRGFMYRELRKGFGSWATIAILAVGFGIPHVHPLWVSMAICAGFVFSLLRDRFANTFVSIILHISYNIISIPMLLTKDTEIYTILFDNIIVEIVYVIAGGAAIYFCLKTLLKSSKGLTQ